MQLPVSLLLYIFSAKKRINEHEVVYIYIYIGIQLLFCCNRRVYFLGKLVGQWNTEI